MQANWIRRACHSKKEPSLHCSGPCVGVYQTHAKVDISSLY